MPHSNSPLVDDSDAPRRCANCDAEVDGDYCGHCGEDNRSPRLSFRSIVAATLDHLVDVDIPVLRTIGQLSWRPGWVAGEYVRGRRKPFTNPLKYCFLAGALQIAVCELLDIGILVLPPGVREQLSRGPEGDAFRTEAVPLLEWFGQYIHIFTFASLPILALFMRGLFRSSGRSVVEHYVLSLYVYGHSFLLQLFAVPLGGITHPTTYTIFKIIPIVMFSWAAVPFCRAPILKGVALSLLAHVAYLAVLMTLGLSVATLHDLFE